MAGNKNSGRKAKEKIAVSNGSSTTRAKSSRVKYQKQKVLPQEAHSATANKTQVKMDKYVKKLGSATTTKGSPKKTIAPVEPTVTKATSPHKKAKEVSSKEVDKGESKQFNCPYCNQGFSRKYDMEKHSRKVVYKYIFSQGNF